MCTDVDVKTCGMQGYSTTASVRINSFEDSDGVVNIRTRAIAAGYNHTHQRFIT
jgi:hypothetical protein